MSSPTPTALRQWIRTSRKRLGWTQVELGRLLGISQATVSQWETGKAVPGEEERREMERHFDGTPEQLEIPAAQTEPDPPGGELASATQKTKKKASRGGYSMPRIESVIVQRPAKYDDDRPQHAELLRQLWEAAVNLRGSIEPADYKRYVLPIIFLRFLSVRFEQRRAELADEVRQVESPYYAESPEEAEFFIEDEDSYRSANVFPIPEEARWDELRKNARADDIKIRLDRALEALEDAYPLKLKGLLPRVFAGSNLSRPSEPVPV